eukprot:TRINITY_DN10498_c0_g1_i1.p1 TRINITY_DN10498_c0_g1~~TRINITY_DN10498_c0_g1_i1.p1  ORF type:complete len:320 (-),score=72.53 TRINITY_DN10498_c0_g1_i1:173-1132(-)
MKVIAVLCITLVAGVLAQEITPPPFVCDSTNEFACTFKEMGHHIKFHATKLGTNLKDVGSNILAAALDQGKNLLATGSQAILGSILEHFNKSGLGRRDIALVDTVKEHLSKGLNFLKSLKDQLKARFNSAVEKLSGLMSNVAGLKQLEENTDKQLDDAVTKFEKDGKMGFFQMAAAIKDRLSAIFKDAMKKLAERFGQKTEEKRAILDIFSKAKEHFTNIVGGIADTFKPHMDALTEGVKGLAAKAKEHGTNLVNAAKDQFDALKGKLTGHLDTIKGHVSSLGDHATNAVNALKEVVSDIVAQTVSNVTGTVADAISGN